VYSLVKVKLKNIVAIDPIVVGDKAHKWLISNISVNYISDII